MEKQIDVCSFLHVHVIVYYTIAMYILRHLFTYLLNFNNTVHTYCTCLYFLYLTTSFTHTPLYTHTNILSLSYPFFLRELSHTRYKPSFSSPLHHPPPTHTQTHPSLHTQRHTDTHTTTLGETQLGKSYKRVTHVFFSFFLILMAETRQVMTSRSVLSSTLLIEWAQNVSRFSEVVITLWANWRSCYGVPPPLDYTRGNIVTLVHE